MRTKMNDMRRRQEQYQSIVEQALLTFANAIDVKDRYTNGHSVRVAQYSRELARIIGVADTYDAMSSDRCYRKALSEDIIKEELNKYKGTQFDPEVVPHMFAMIDEGIVPIPTEKT